VSLLFVGLMRDLKAEAEVNVFKWTKVITIRHDLKTKKEHFVIGSITPKVDDKANVVITTNGVGSSEGYVDIEFKKPGKSKVTVTWMLKSGHVWPEGTDPESEIPPPDDIFEDMGVQVELKPIPNGDEGDDPILSPKICLNAQAKYKKATWIATVLPEGTTASLKVLSGAITVVPNSQIEDETKIKITGNGTGKYIIKLTHDALDICYMEGESIVFKFEKSKEMYTSKVTEDYVIVDGKTYYKPKYYKPLSYNLNSCSGHIFNYTCRANGGVIGVVANAEFTIELNANFKVNTKPANAFLGKVSADTSIKLSGQTYIDAPTSGVTNTAGYGFVLKVGTAAMAFPNQQENSKWKEDFEKNLSFSVPASGQIKVESHACAQIEGAQSASAGVAATHGKVKIKNFKIIK